MSPHPRHPARPLATLLAATLLVGALAAGSAPAGAQATTTITFNGLTDPANVGARYVDNGYVEGGLRFTVQGVAPGTPAALASWGPAESLYYTGSPALFNNSAASSTMLLTAASGGTFSFFSIGLAPVLGQLGPSTTVQFMGMLNTGSSVTNLVTVPAGMFGTPTAPTTFTFSGFTNLTSLSVTVTGPAGTRAVQMDNIGIALSPAVVPEPATVLLLGSGLAGLGALGWRRRRAALG
jgi:hypothetical protein